MSTQLPPRLPFPSDDLFSTGSADYGTWMLNGVGRRVFEYFYRRYMCRYMELPESSVDVVLYPLSRQEWYEWVERFQTSEQILQWEERNLRRWPVSEPIYCFDYIVFSREREC